MSEINDGGSAFPVGEDVTLGQWKPQPGMSIRDYAAIHAPGDLFDYFAKQEDVERFTGIKRLPMTDAGCQDRCLLIEAIIRYRWADAMLKAREVGP